MMLDACRHLVGIVHSKLHKILLRSNADIIRYCSLKNTSSVSELVPISVFNFLSKCESDIIKRCVRLIPKLTETSSSNYTCCCLRSKVR